MYVEDNSKSMSRLCVKLTYTFSGTGLQAPIFITVSGLTKEELPINTCPYDILHLQVDGLAIGGGGVQVGGTGTGHVVFIRNNYDKDKTTRRESDTIRTTSSSLSLTRSADCLAVGSQVYLYQKSC
jgi:hypothetical protein